ncbi:hypothetical protein GCM10009111_33940 [Colwellia asteriadis]|uniref:Ice-binding protein C-terminal domain-containing protein n=1 Tax=Colwellia asteriadis TaxID=517723 RepID=A0ABP3WM66_9GAMM
MNKFKKIIAASAIMLASASASASVINVGGVTWDPDYNNGAPNPFNTADFLGKGEFFQSFQDSLGNYVSNALAVNGDILSGFGEFNLFNGASSQGAGDFCVGCSLTLEFGGFTLAGIGPNPLKNGVVGPLFTGGWAKVFVDTNGVSNGQLNTYNDGVEWLTLSAMPQFGNSTMTLDGSVAGGGSAEIFWNVTGGIAAGNFDTNGAFQGSDIHYTASAQGNDGTFEANGNTIPEPTTLAMFGLALLGLAGTARRKSK